MLVAGGVWKGRVRDDGQAHQCHLDDAVRYDQSRGGAG